MATWWWDDVSKYFLELVEKLGGMEEHCVFITSKESKEHFMGKVSFYEESVHYK